MIHKPERFRRLPALLLAMLAAFACADESSEASKSPWKKFVQVAGQPESVPEQWVSTPEGKFAHSIVIPNPVPKDSSYRRGMSSKEYFEHLCKTEAGEFIFKTVENVKGFYFMRPPRRPTDDDLKDLYKLEAPEIERTFQLRRATPESRAALFVDPPWRQYVFVEEPNSAVGTGKKFVRAFGRVQDKSKMRSLSVESLQSRYGLTWRGIRRHNDRQHAVAGGEWIVIDLKSLDVLAVQRNYGRTGFNRNTPGGIWWLNAVRCPQVKSRNSLGGRFYEFVSRSIRPAAQELK